MSYTILYRSMFAKVGEDRFIPMIEVGDSNCYEFDSRKRARSWENWRVPGLESKIILSRREIMDGVHKLIQDTEDHWVNKPSRDYDCIPGPYWTYRDIYKNYGWLAAISVGSNGCSKTTARMVENFFNRGFEQAVDVEHLKYWGYLPIIMKHYENGQCKSEYFDDFNELINVCETRDGKDYWVTYTGTESLWQHHKNRRK